MAVLRDVHRDVGVLKKRVDALAVLGVGGDADADCDLQREAGEGERRLEHPMDPCRECRGVLVRSRREEDAELVAAEAGQGLARAHCLAEPARDLLQEAIAGLMAERVVDLPEAVDVQKHDRGRVRLLPGGRDRLLDPVAEQRSVRQAGELVIERASLDFLHLPSNALCHPPEDRNEREEEEEEHDFEDGCDRHESGFRRPRDRPVVLEDRDDARSARDGDRCVGAQGLLAACRPRRPEAGHVAADRPGESFANVPRARDSRADEPVVGAVGDRPVLVVEIHEQHALREDVLLEQLVEGRAAALRRRSCEV